MGRVINGTMLILTVGTCDLNLTSFQAPVLPPDLHFSTTVTATMYEQVLETFQYW
jgi:hypothetical protein